MMPLDAKKVGSMVDYTEEKIFIKFFAEPDLEWFIIVQTKQQLTQQLT